MYSLQACGVAFCYCRRREGSRRERRSAPSLNGAPTPARGQGGLRRAAAAAAAQARAVGCQLCDDSRVEFAVVLIPVCRARLLVPSAAQPSGAGGRSARAGEDCCAAITRIWNCTPPLQPPDSAWGTPGPVNSPQAHNGGAQGLDVGAALALHFAPAVCGGCWKRVRNARHQSTASSLGGGELAPAQEVRDVDRCPICRAQIRRTAHRRKTERGAFCCCPCYAQLEPATSGQLSRFPCFSRWQTFRNPHGASMA